MCAFVPSWARGLALSGEAPIKISPHAGFNTIKVIMNDLAKHLIALSKTFPPVGARMAAQLALPPESTANPAKWTYERLGKYITEFEAS